MFRTLRTKLSFAFGAITVLSILVVGVGFFFLLRDREVQAAQQRIGDQLPAEAAQVGMFARAGVPADRIGGYLRQEAQSRNVRFVLLDDSSHVVEDTDGKQTGQTIALQSGKSGRNVPNSYKITGWKEGPVRYVGFYLTTGGPQLLQQRTLVPTQYTLLMLVPEKSISSAWHDLAPRIVAAGVFALIATLAVAYFVARSITRPITRITRASEAMAEGNYDQQITVEGRDEVARLATTFNTMASQVSASHRVMRDLLANVAHELKTPLTSIQGFSQALADGTAQSPEEYATAARIINEESERMRRLVNDLLYLSQLESGQLELELQPVEIPTLLSVAAERVEPQLAETGKTLKIENASSLPQVLVDPRRIEQVLANLVDNAIRYTPAGGTITLRSRRTGDRVAIDVHNTGSYIPPEQVHRVFERFYQVDHSRRRGGSNGGLGLAIAREILTAHGGTIEASSEPELGTTFTVTLNSLDATARHSVGTRSVSSGSDERRSNTLRREVVDEKHSELVGETSR
jgi:signal transduction histidine kinase